MRSAPAHPCERPWYREMWPWLLMLPPGLAVAGGIAMLWLATRTPGALVVEDYARIEALTSERFELDRAASRLAVSAELSFARETGRVEAALAAQEAYELPAALTLVLRHATNPAADRHIRLVRFGSLFRADTPIPTGRYHVELFPEDRSWRLGGAAGRLDGRVLLRPHADGT